MNKRNEIFLLMLNSWIFFLGVLCVTASESGKVQKFMAANSSVATSVLDSNKYAIVATYDKGDQKLNGLSGCPDGKQIKAYEILSAKLREKIRGELANDDNFNPLFGPPEKNVKMRNWNQGVEFTDGNAFVRVYFTQDGEYCMFFTSSGERSQVFLCSEKLRLVAIELLAILHPK